jgi:hypothetical protein
LNMEKERNGKIKELIYICVYVWENEVKDEF